MMRALRTIAGLVIIGLLAAGVAACSASDTRDDQIEGVVIEVTGDVATVESFVVLDANGNSHRFVPQEGLLFDGGPLSHLQSHVVSGEPVLVTFETGQDEAMTAIAVEDAG